MVRRIDIVTVQHGVVLGQWVKARRDARVWTQEQLAERMGEGVTTNWVGQLESGARKQKIAQPFIGMLARAFGVSEVEVLRGAGMITDAPIEDAAAPDDDLQRDIAQLSDHQQQAVRAFLAVLRAERSDKPFPFAVPQVIEPESHGPR